MALCRRLVLFRSYLFLLVLFGGAFIWQLSVINNVFLFEEYVPEQTVSREKLWTSDLYNNKSDTKNKLESRRLQEVVQLLPVTSVIADYKPTIKVVGSHENKNNASILNKKNASEDSWKEVFPSKDGRILVFSAYFDNRVREPLVRVMAAVLTKRRNPIFCGMYDADGKYRYHVLSKLRKLPENWNLPYSAVHIQCILPHKAGQVPHWVAVAEEYKSFKTMSSSMLLPVHHRGYLDNHNGSLRNESTSNSRFATPKGFALCVKPLHYNYDRAVWLVEFFEMHRILGIEHFFIYNHTVGPNVQKVLEYYQHTHLVTVLPWKLDLKSQKDIRTEGIFVALNDCLYRTMYKYKYTVMVDFDEYIIPMKANQTYPQLVSELQKPKTGSFIFQNFFFYLYWNNDTAILDQFKPFITNESTNLEDPTTATTQVRMADVPYLITLFKTQRVKVPNKHLVRSKYIVRPELAVIVGNHNIHEHVPGYTKVLVPHTTASSHHYRICEFGGYDCLRKPHERDNSTWSYAPQLIPRLFDVCKSAFPATGNCPPAPPLGPAF